MEQDVGAGIIMSNHSLVLQRVNRTSSGLYTCSAENVVGTYIAYVFHKHCLFGSPWKLADIDLDYR